MVTFSAEFIQLFYLITAELFENVGPLGLRACETFYLIFTCVIYEGEFGCYLVRLKQFITLALFISILGCYRRSSINNLDSNAFINVFGEWDISFGMQAATTQTILFIY